ncbi:MAG: COX15/CtaA family protein [Thermoleophilaceae bacterium]
MTPSTGFRRLAVAGVASTVALILLGGLVRVSGSGLGCGPAGSGLEGWPLCRGDVVPGLELTAVIEYSHRALASIVGVIMIALAVLAWWRLRPHRGIVRAAAAAAGLVVVQGLLGAATVELNLDAALVAAHLLLAMILLALMVYILRASRAENIGAPAAEGGGSFRVLASLAPLAVLATIVAGGYMAGTENHGRTDREQTVGAHYACGTEFPTCNGELMPLGQAPLVDVHLAHRAFMYLASALVLALAVVALRRRPSRAIARLAAGSVAVLALQILVGALNVWIAPQEGVLIMAHLALATALWGSLVGLRLRLSPVPAPASARAPRRGAEAVTA